MDLRCQICGEPFAHYHVVHDMESNERATFLAGLGCFHCHGEIPAGGKPPMAEIMTIAMDTIGVGDLDGVASMLEDYESMQPYVGVDKYDGGQW